MKITKLGMLEAAMWLLGSAFVLLSGMPLLGLPSVTEDDDE